MRNSLQDQLLKSGLVNEKKLKDANRAKSKQAKQAGKNAAQLDEERRLAAQALRDKADGDRMLAQQRNAVAHQRELAAQIVQLVQHYRQSRMGSEQALIFITMHQQTQFCILGRNRFR